jgi:hypothetical protein
MKLEVETLFAPLYYHLEDREICKMLPCMLPQLLFEKSGTSKNARSA